MIGKQARPKRIGRRRNESFLTRSVNAVSGFPRMAEFEILCVLFIVVTFFIFKELMSRPGYNQILVNNYGGSEFSS